MRIAVVEPAARGGMLHYAFQLCRALAAAGAEVTLVTAHGDELGALPAPFRVVRLLRLWDSKPAGEPAPASALARRLRRAGRAVRWYREWLRLAAFLARERPDWVQLGDLRFAADAAGVALLRLAGLRLAAICHNVRPFALGGRAAGRFRLSPRARALYRAAYRRCDRVFVHFESNRRAFLDAFGLPPERVTAVPHGNQALFAEQRDPTLDGAALRRRLDLGAGEPVVLFFGTLAPYKGIDVLLAAWPAVARAHPRARLVVAGYPLPGFDLAAHRDLAGRLGIATAVRWVPRYVPSAEVAAWMELAAAVAFPYREVFQSGALAIAQTFARPVVASAAGALPEAVGEGGLVVPPGDPAALGAALTRLLADPALAAELGKRAGEAARGRLAWERVAAALLAEYRAPAPAGRPAGAGAR